jgi:hypothetical protein
MHSLCLPSGGHLVSGQSFQDAALLKSLQICISQSSINLIPGGRVKIVASSAIKIVNYISSSSSSSSSTSTSSSFEHIDNTHINCTLNHVIASKDSNDSSQFSSILPNNEKQKRKLIKNILNNSPKNSFSYHFYRLNRNHESVMQLRLSSTNISEEIKRKKLSKNIFNSNNNNNDINPEEGYVYIQIITQFYQPILNQINANDKRKLITAVAVPRYPMNFSTHSHLSVENNLNKFFYSLKPQRQIFGICKFLVYDYHKKALEFFGGARRVMLRGNI